MNIGIEYPEGDDIDDAPEDWGDDDAGIDEDL